MRKICKYCGKEFETTGRVYCSSECHEQALISRHTFVCKGCGKSFYSKWRSAAWCSAKCHNRTVRLRRTHRCPTCLKIFFGASGQTYCSRECEYESLRTAERNHICINCGKEFVRPKRDRDSCQFCSRECGSEYRSRAARQSTIHKQRSNRIRRCCICDRIFFLMGHQARYCSDACRQTQYNNPELRRQRFKPQKKICRNCGEEFMTAFKKSKVFCSDDCKVRYTKERKKQRDRHRLDGIVVDDDITLAKLYRRDNGICQLCGLPTDWNDYQLNSDGYRVTGRNYPSVDHIYPISHGGLHAWDNVQLAHHYCNGIKSDSEWRAI